MIASSIKCIIYLIPVSGESLHLWETFSTKKHNKASKIFPDAKKQRWKLPHFKKYFSGINIQYCFNKLSTGNSKINIFIITSSPFLQPFFLLTTDINRDLLLFSSTYPTIQSCKFKDCETHRRSNMLQESCWKFYVSFVRLQRSGCKYSVWKH